MPSCWSMPTHGRSDDMDSSASQLNVATAPIDFDEALAVVLGYCLGQEELTWSEGSYAFGQPSAASEWSAFAYRTYDCIEGSAGEALEPIDILVADGLNAKMVARNIAGALAVADEVSVELKKIAPTTTFWDLSSEQVGHPPGPEDEVAWPIWRAWWLLRGVPGLNVARVHKILHHKRPKLFPLIDRKTRARLPGSPWAAIHADLRATQPAWQRLETEVSPFLSGDGHVQLARLRLHDILLWTVATERWDLALHHGRRIRDAS